MTITKLTTQQFLNEALQIDRGQTCQDRVKALEQTQQEVVNLVERIRFDTNAAELEVYARMEKSRGREATVPVEAAFEYGHTLITDLYNKISLHTEAILKAIRDSQ